MKCTTRAWCSGIANRGGFTLIELIVVMAVFVVAIGFVVPVVRKVRNVAGSAGCGANLQQISTAFTEYAAEYDNRYPFGFIFNKQNSIGRPALGDINYITWFSSCDKYLTSGASVVIPYDSPGTTGWIDGGTTRRFSTIFRCPAVPANYLQQVHYFQHGVVMPHSPLELGSGGVPVRLRTPARTTEVNPNTALVWDTQIWISAPASAPSLPWWSDVNGTSGAALACTMIDDNRVALNVDGGLLVQPQYPERRFRGPGEDRFATSTNALKNPSGPIAWPSDKFLQSIGWPYPMNSDFDTAVFRNGIPRFRHDGPAGPGCNVLFADGSVQTLYLRPGDKVSNGPTGAANFIDSDFRREMLMTPWREGIHDSGNYPTN